MVDPERSRFWVSDSREGEVLRVGVQQRVTEFVGKEEVISWRCGAALGGGGLCQRQDRRKCPFHGTIVERDGQGRPLAGSSQGAQGSTGGMEKAQGSIRDLEEARGSIFDLDEDDGEEEGSSREDHEQGSKKEQGQGSSKVVEQGSSQEQGSDDEQNVSRAVSEGVARATKRAQKRVGLRGAERWDETARSRLEKKVFNRAAVGRVTRDLLKYRKIRTKDKFVDQFNY